MGLFIRLKGEGCAVYVTGSTWQSDILSICQNLRKLGKAGWLIFIEGDKELLEALDAVISFIDEFRELNDTILSNLSVSQTDAEYLDHKVRELIKNLIRCTKMAK